MLVYRAQCDAHCWYDWPVGPSLVATSWRCLSMMVRGFLAEGWMAALVESGTPKPERRMKTLQRLTWDDFAFPLWLQRNDVLHKNSTNEYNCKEDRMLSAKITWYQKHRQDILSIQDLTTLHRMKRETKRAWTNILDKARAAYDNERNQRASSQNVITRYFQTTTQGAPENTTDTNGDTPETNLYGQLGPTETTTYR